MVDGSIPLKPQPAPALLDDKPAREELAALRDAGAPG